MKKTAALSAVACVLLATAAAQTRTSNQRDLPLFADDLGAGERYYTFDHADTFSQKFGYDISVRRMKSDGNWTAVKDGVTDYSTSPTNENNVAWGKNFYAMADGVIIGCWRNAPSNPRPKLSSESNDTTALKDRGWIHQNLKDGLMSGGGNHVSVLHDDGTYALYAHAIPGSIPASVCPNNKTKYDQPESDSDPRTEHCVRQSNAVQNGARIKKGQLLGRIGNSGSSTGPHLHVHIAKYDKSKSCTSDLVLEGVPINFSRGMSTPWSDGKADIDAWTSFSGKPITKGNVLFWPPTRLSDEYARHGFQPDDYGRMFDHLANSGFKPVIFDAYTVGGNTRYNFVWRKSDRLWRAHRDQSFQGFQQTAEKNVADGFEPVWAESYTTKNGVRYAAIYEKGAPGSYLLKHGITEAQHEEWLDKAKAQGLKPVVASVVSADGQLRYTVLYRSNNIGSWQLKSQIKEADYQGVFNEIKAAGRWPIYAAAYMHQGKPQFSVIFASSGGPAAAGHGLTAQQYQQQYSANTGAGRLTQVVTGYDGAQQNHRYIGVWK